MQLQSHHYNMLPDLQKRAQFTHPMFQVCCLIKSTRNVRYGCETFKDCRTTIPLSSLKVSTLCIIRCDFYGSLNTQNWMCELCTFSQIRSHISNILIFIEVVFLDVAIASQLGIQKQKPFENQLSTSQLFDREPVTLN